MIICVCVSVVRAGWLVAALEERQRAAPAPAAAAAAGARLDDDEQPAARQRRRRLAPLRPPPRAPRLQVAERHEQQPIGAELRRQRALFHPVR